MQDEYPTVWISVDDGHAFDKVEFLTVSTGMELLQEMHNYIGTYQYRGFVGHVFSRQLT